MTYNIKWVSGVYVCVCSVAQLCPSLCDPMDGSLPGSSVHGIILARLLEWVASSSSIFFFKIWLHRVWVAACSIFLVATSGILSWGLRTLSCSMWDQISWAGTKPRPSALGAWNLSCWISRKVPVLHFVYIPHTQATHRATQDKAWLLPRPSCVLSHIWLFSTPWTVAHQAPLCMGFSSQEYQSGLPFPPPRYLPNSAIEPEFAALQSDALPLSHQGSPLVAELGLNME